MRILLVGARRTRQGLGPFVASSFLEAGARIAGVVGTSEESVAGALHELPRPDGDPGPAPEGFTDLHRALEATRPDAVAVCSPYAHHREALEIVASHGVNCLCEKPLWWEEHPDRVGETRRLVEEFRRRDLLLEILTQWPFTLDEYREIFPPGEGPGNLPHRFHMILSPSCRGPGVIPDSAPHLLSMLQKLFGAGDVIPRGADYFGEDRGQLWIEFTYEPEGEEAGSGSPSPSGIATVERGPHAPEVEEKPRPAGPARPRTRPIQDLSTPLLPGAGPVAVTFHCITAESPPRRAAYGLDGRMVHRQIELPEYRQVFRAERDGKSLSRTLEDPLKKLVRNFLKQLQSRALTDTTRLVGSMKGLEILHGLVRTARVLPVGDAPDPGDPQS